jgi:hypothetical protein
VLEELRKQGFVILEGLLSSEELRTITLALAPYEEARPPGRTAFEGKQSKRVYSLAGKGEVFLGLAEHPRIVALLDEVLLPNWLLSTMQSIPFYIVPRPHAPLSVSVIWAIEDFSDENGATEVIPGSHLWASEHPDERPDAKPVPARMRAGSAIVFDAGLWHRGGENRSKGTRLAVSPQYCQPWLRPQESQLLIVGPDAAKRCSPRGRAMLGYSIHPPFIGQVDGMHPLRLVDPDYRAHKTDARQIADEMLREPQATLERSGG